MSTTSPPGRLENPTSQLLAEHPAIARFGKLGWLAKGVVYVVAGVLAIVIVGKSQGWSSTESTSDQEASPNGALKTVAQMSWGPALMWLLAIGLLIYALWRFVSASLPGSSEPKAWLKRIGYVVSGIAYLTFAWTAVRLAASSSTESDGNSKVTDLTARTMEHTAGRLLVGVIGVIVIAVGLYRIGKGVKNDVGDELDLSGMSPSRTKATRTLGRVGEIGRGVGIGLVGVFLLIAAIDYKADEATGLDGALRKLSAESWGVVVVAVVAIGFLAYGLFCVVTFSRRRLESP